MTIGVGAGEARGAAAFLFLAIGTIFHKIKTTHYEVKLHGQKSLFFYR